MIQLTFAFSSETMEARDNRISLVHYEKINVNLEFHI